MYALHRGRRSSRRRLTAHRWAFLTPSRDVRVSAKLKCLALAARRGTGLTHGNRAGRPDSTMTQYRCAGKAADQCRGSDPWSGDPSLLEVVAHRAGIVAAVLRVPESELAGVIVASALESPASAKGDSPMGRLAAARRFGRHIAQNQRIRREVATREAGEPAESRAVAAVDHSRAHAEATDSTLFRANAAA
jgi:hypothetical protein